MGSRTAPPGKNLARDDDPGRTVDAPAFLGAIARTNQPQCDGYAHESASASAVPARHGPRKSPGMPHVEPRVHAERYDELRPRRASWFSVFAGTAVALAISVLLNLMGFAVGITTIDPTGETPTLNQLGTGAWIWMLVAGIVSLFIGGWVTGRETGVPKRSQGAIHGAVTWSLFTLISVVLMMSVAGRIVNNATRMVGSAFSAAGQAAQAVADTANVNVTPQGIEMGGQQGPVDLAWQSIWNEGQQILQQTQTEELQPQDIQEDLQGVQQEMQQAATAESPEQARKELQDALQKLQQSARETVSEVDQEAVVNVLTARTGMSEAEARRTVQRWSLIFQMAWQRADAQVLELQNIQKAARQGAQTATDALARVSWWTFSYLLLTLGAASIGGFLGGFRRRAYPRGEVETVREEPSYPVTEEHPHPRGEHYRDEE